MEPDWMALPLEDYREILIDVAVRSGLYEALNREVNDCGDEPWIKNPIATRILDALGEVGLVKTDHHGYHWIGEEPDPRVLQRWGQVRSWLELTEHLSPWFHGKDIWTIDLDQERLQMSAASLSHWLGHQIRPQAGSSWLDIGAGTGVWAKELLRWGAKVVIAEKPEVMARIPHVPGVQRWSGDIFQSMPHGLFDGVTLIRFIEDFSPEQIESLFVRIAPRLKPRGRVYVVGYFRDRCPLGALFDVHVLSNTGRGRCYSVNELDSMALSSGFAVESEMVDTQNYYVAVELALRQNMNGVKEHR